MNNKDLDVLELQKIIEKQKKLIEKLKYKASIDDLTGLYNRDYGMMKMKNIHKFCKKNDKEFTLIFLDIDNFKCINDKLGHRRGDEVLTIIGKIIKKNLSKEDIAIRYGGDEFLIYLYGKNKKSSINIWNKIKKEIKEETQRKLCINVTLSNGMVEKFQMEEEGLSWLIERADFNMYKNKHNYKNNN